MTALRAWGRSLALLPQPITHQRGGHRFQFCDITQVVIPGRPVVHIGDYSPLDSMANYRQESDVFKSTLSSLLISRAPFSPERKASTSMTGKRVEACCVDIALDKFVSFQRAVLRAGSQPVRDSQ